MRNLKKYSNHSGYSADERVLGYNVSICKSDGHTHYDKPYDSKIAYLEIPVGAYVNSEQYITDETGFMYNFIGNTQGTAPIGYMHNIYGHSRVLFTSYRNNYNAYWHTTQLNLSSIGSEGDNVRCELNYYNDRKWRVNTTEHATLCGTLGIAQSSKPIYIGACSQGDSDSLYYNNASHTFFAAQVTQGSELVLDLIPVRVGTTGYMYDRVSKRLFGNAGTGEFVLGPDI